ncbi:MAG TPA: exodeoxyribonuclease VII small subunit [Candidatus Hydrogenedentes bacterium]|nr:exodeoxyribonuclease VII small subunit [Candidatus Hydrogenedentota bacterium]
MAEKKPNFEKDLENLEEIVGALEEGGLSLDDSLKRFEEGITLARRCEKTLTEAEKKVEILLKNTEGELEAQPFGEVESEDAEKPETTSRESTPPAEKDEEEMLF